MSEPKPPPKHLSLIRTFVLADFITIGNGFAGTGAILAMMQYLATGERSALWVAFGLLPIALVLDAADGRVAAGGTNHRRWGAISTLWLT